MSLEQKIHEIHAILVRQESRRKWRIFFSWCVWLVILGIIAILIWYPSVVMTAFTPLFDNILNDMKDALTQTFEGQKEQWYHSLSGSIEQARGFIGQ